MSMFDTFYSDMQRRGLMLVLSSPSGAGQDLDCPPPARKRRSVDHVRLGHHTAPATGGGGRRRLSIHRPDRVSADDKPGRVPGICKSLRQLLRNAARPVEAVLNSGKDVLFDIDWQGTQQVADAARDDLVSVFILPPSTHELERRLMGRAQDSAEVVARRMSKAADEISHYREYDYIIVNSDLNKSVEAVSAILTAERLKRDRQRGLTDFVKLLREGR